MGVKELCDVLEGKLIQKYSQISIGVSIIDEQNIRIAAFSVVFQARQLQYIEVGRLLLRIRHSDYSLLLIAKGNQQDTFSLLAALLICI